MLLLEWLYLRWVLPTQSNLFPTHGKPGSPWSAFHKNNTMLTQVFLHDVVHNMVRNKQNPPIFPEMSQLVCKTKFPLIAWRGRVKVVWDSMWECIRVLSSSLMSDSLWVKVLTFPLITAGVEYAHVSVNECLCNIWMVCLSLHFQSHSSHFSGLYGAPSANAITHQHSVCSLKYALQCLET